MRRRRWLIVGALISSLAFAQTAAAAHACAMLAALSAPVPAMEAGAHPMQPGCAEMAKESQSTLNVCMGHCFAGQQAHGQADVPTPGIAAQPVLTVRIAEEHVRAYFNTSSLALVVAGPEPVIRFNRLLI